MMRNPFSIVSLMLIMFPVFGCATPQEQSEGNEILVPDYCHMSQEQIEELEEKSKKGDCHASMALFDYYATCTKYIYLALHYGVLADEQGCEAAEEAVANVEIALGIRSEPTMPQKHNQSSYSTSGSGASLRQ